MKAVVYQAPFSIAAENVPDPELQHPNDNIVKITSSCICGSDLHMYEGRTAAQPGIIFGHENMGVVQEVGSAVKTQCGGPGCNALQCSVRVLRELPERIHRFLHHGEPWLCRWCLAALPRLPGRPRSRRSFGLGPGMGDPGVLRRPPENTEPSRARAARNGAIFPSEPGTEDHYRHDGDTSNGWELITRERLRMAAS